MTVEEAVQMRKRTFLEWLEDEFTKDDLVTEIIELHEARNYGVPDLYHQYEAEIAEGEER